MSPGHYLHGHPASPFYRASSLSHKLPPNAAKYGTSGPIPFVSATMNPPKLIASYFHVVTVLQADICSFTPFCARSTPQQVIWMLNELFVLFDTLTDQHKVYKVETIGDAYLAVAGCPTPNTRHAECVADLAITARDALRHFTAPHGTTQTYVTSQHILACPSRLSPQVWPRAPVFSLSSCVFACMCVLCCQTLPPSRCALVFTAVPWWVVWLAC